MATRFEVTLDPPDHFLFLLKAADGSVLLSGLSGTSKIMVQNEILQVRNALREPDRLVSHHGDDGSHFVVIKDRKGSVVAKSPHVKSHQELDGLLNTIRGAVGGAPIVDLTKRAHAS